MRPLTDLAERKNARAAFMSRVSLNSTSTSAPLRSMARLKIAPAPIHLEVGFIDIPAAARLAATALPQVLGQRRRELGLPLADGLMAEYDTAQGEHLGQVAQAQLVAQPPEHHERDDVGRILRPVQQRAGAFVELLAAGPAAKAPVTLFGALRPLRHRL